MQDRREYQRLYRLNNREELARKSKLKYPIYSQRIKERHRENQETCFDYYGHTCNWPGCRITQSEFLAFDHINNDGWEHRTASGANQIIPWLIKNNFPEGVVQILCHNHNWLKELERRKSLWKQTPRAIAGRKSAAKLRLEVCTYYSPNKILGCSCLECEVRDLNLLTIDHISGGGARHHREIGVNIDRWLRNNGFPSGFSTLCWNCNLSRGFCGYCPHEKNKA